MRLARLAVAGLALGILAGFIAALLRPRRRLADEPMASQSLSQADEPIGWGTRPHRTPLPPLVPVVPKAKPSGPVFP